jgi:two-component system sensor histidine kinase KdpD
LNKPPAWHHYSVTKRPLYIGAVGVVFVTVCLAFLLHRLMPHASLSLLFLTGVLIVSARTGLGPSLVASVLSFLAYNFFFTPPYYTLQVADDGDVATLLFFLLMAAITGNLAARMYTEIDKRRTSLQRISNLYAFSRRMSSSAGTEAVLEALADHLAQSTGRTVAVLVAAPGSLPAVRARAGRAASLHPADIKDAWSRDDPGPAVIHAWHFLKLIAHDEPVGMVAILGQVDAEQIDLARSLCDQATVALDRTRLVADLEQARLVSETEQLRSALLSSVSHDLRTPLASIIGSTTSLLEYGDSFSTENRRDLLATVVAEAQRLDRHIQNLLDMTRLGQGKMTLRRDWVDLHDIVSSAVDRLRDALKGLPVTIDIADTVPLLWVHGVLIEQALVNLLDNAICFSPPDGRITITARAAEGRVEIDLCDDGPGIPVNEREKIFDMFYTVRQGDRGNLQGTGLGLAICRGMVAAHGGNVTARDGRNGRGTCMRIVLPVTRPEGMDGE